MKNMKIASRIMLGFLIAIGLTIVLGVVSIYGLNETRSLMEEMYSGPYQAQINIGDMQASLEKTGRDTYQLATATTEEEIQSLTALTEQRYTELITAARALAELSPEHQQMVQEFEDVVVNQAAPLSEHVISTVRPGVDQASELGAFLNEQYAPVLDQAVKELEDIATVASEQGEQFMQTADQTCNVLIWITIAVLIVEVVVALILASVITQSIRGPVEECTAATELIAQGNLDVNVTYESRDAVGQMAANLRSMVRTLKSYIHEISTVLRDIAGGDLNVEVKEHYMGDFESIGDSMERIIESLNSVFSGMDQAAGQVAIGATEVSRGAQALAEGATKQSASVEELSASIGHVNEQIQHTTGNVAETQELVGKTASLIDTCNDQMSALLGSMDEINVSSQEISKIIKVIDDISFQTNILALNAAVEAARAGTAGQGFAVVADEVRNLATKSAEAAKETSALIEGSLQKVEVGNKNAMETAEVLKAIVENSTRIHSNVEEIGVASEDQAHSVQEINNNVEQISSVVQTNSATAEESAAASEELSGQADMMKQMVARFHLKDGGEGMMQPPMGTGAHNSINMDYRAPSSPSSWDAPGDDDKY